MRCGDPDCDGFCEECGGFSREGPAPDDCMGRGQCESCVEATRAFAIEGEIAELLQGDGADLIRAERLRQVEDEGWAAGHDDLHADEELAWAAVCYAAPGFPTTVYRRWEQQRSPTAQGGVHFVDPWPWARKWDKRTKALRGDDPLWARAGDTRTGSGTSPRRAR